MRAALSSAPHVVTAEVAWIGGIAWTLLLLAWEGEYVCKHSGFEVPPFLPLPRRFRFRPAHGLVLHAPFVPKWRLGDPPLHVGAGRSVSWAGLLPRLPFAPCPADLPAVGSSGPAAGLEP